MALACAGARAGTNHIGLGGLSFDPRLDTPPEALEMGQRARGQPSLYVVQAEGPITPAFRAALEERGLAIVDYVPHNAYLVAGREVTAGELLTVPGARAAMDYLPALKLAPDVRAWRGRAETVPLVLGVLAEGLAGTASRLAALGAVVRGSDILLGQGRLRIVASGRLIEALARDPEVVSLSLDLPQVAEGEVAKRIIDGTDGAGPGPLPPGYLAFLARKGVDGSGVTVAVIDNGVDVNDASGHLNGRIVSALRGATEGSATGHGHHVAGIVAGQCSHPADPQGYLWGIGVAPGACLLNIPALKAGYTGTDQEQVRDAVTIPSTNGQVASIASCSWNNGEGSDYTMAERTWDAFVRDADDLAPGFQPLFLSFSAGNTGPGPSSLTRPHAGKNVVAAANSHSYRPSLGSPDQNRMSITSSRGPAADGRIKPDLAAPGTNIASAQSGTFACGPNQIDTLHVYCSGTSMAQPHVAGAAALFTEWWRARTGADPSPALIKAALIHGARDMVDTGEGRPWSTGPIPNADEGWGLVSLDATIDPGPATVHRDQSAVLQASGQEWSLEVALADPARPLGATVVWTDAPGAVGANPALVNDLDLVVEGSLGSRFVGNAFRDGQSDPTGVDPDRVNNVEQVRVAGPARDLYTVRVQGFNIAGDALPGVGGPLEQDFAIVLSNVLEPRSDGLLQRLGGDLSCSGQLVILVGDADLLSPPTVAVTSTTEPQGEMVALAAARPGSRFFRGTIDLDAGPPQGDGRLQVRDGDQVVITYVDADDGMGGINVSKTVMATVDCRGPVISAVDLTAIDDRTLRIRFDTDEPATSDAVLIGEGRAVSSSARVTAHELALGGLEPCAFYRVRVEAVDAAGNRSVDDNQGLGHPVTLPHRRLAFGADFEADGGGFSHFGPREEWQWGAPLRGPTQAASGDRLWATDLDGSYAKDGVSGLNGVFVLLSPPIDLSAATAPRMRVRRWNDIATDGSTDDGAWVEVWDGSAWSFLTPRGGYGETIDADAPLPPDATVEAAWAGESGGWAESEFDLARFAGSTVRVRFVVFEEDDFLAGAPGLYLDDIEVFDLESCQSARLDVMEPAVGCGGVVTVRVEDSGLNLDPAAIDSAEAFVYADSEPAGEPLTITELAANRGIFEAVVAAADGPARPDGTLQVRTGDRVWAYYRDVDDGSGRARDRWSELTADCTAPAIGGVAVVAVTDRSFELQWETDEPATTGVSYGTTPGLGNRFEDRSLTRRHTARLEGLAACTTYLFQVESADLARNFAVEDASGRYFRVRTGKGDGIAFLDDFEADRGWTLDGEWERDRPRGQRFATSASMDPNAALTLDRVLGLDLTGRGLRPGDYESGSSSSAVSPGVDARSLGQAELRFHRWLGVDRSDAATLDVSGDGGTNWTELWRNPAGVDVSDRLWTDQIFDITAVAAGRPDVRVRFALQADASAELMGWQIDDLVILDPTRPPWGPCGADLALESYQVDDAAGDGDGIAEAGERVRLPLRVSNGGVQPATQVMASATSGRPDLALVTGSTTSFPDIAPGAMASSVAPQIELEISELAVCGAQVPLNLSLWEASGGTAVPLRLQIGAPTLRPVAVASPGGPLSIPDRDATGVVATLSVTDDDPIAAIEVEVRATHPEASDLTVALTAPWGELVLLHNLSRDGQSYTTTVYPSGQVPDGPGRLEDLAGRVPRGTWSLRAIDGRANNTGTLSGWTLMLTLVDGRSQVVGPVSAPLLLTRAGQDIQAAFGSAPGAVRHALQKGRRADLVGRSAAASATNSPILELQGMADPGAWFYAVRGLDECGREGP